MTLDPGWAAFLGAIVGGGATLFGTWLTMEAARRAARRADDALVSATALLIQDDFLHYQATLAHALDRCSWWDPAELLHQQATVEDRKTVWAALPDDRTNVVADAQGWMDYLIQRRMVVGPTETRLRSQDVDTMRMTFGALGDGRIALRDLANRPATDFTTSRVLETLENCHTVEELLARRCPDPSPAVVLRSDAIRIVPLYTGGGIGVAGAAAAPAVAPRLTYRGGPLLGAAEVVTVFWGSAWSTPQQAPLAGRLNAFFDAILVSPLIDQLAEYSVPATAIGHGRRSATAAVAADPPAVVSDGAVQQFLREQTTTNAAVPAPTAQTLYFVYLPPGVAVTQGGGRSCQAFCGYHSDIAGRLFYAVMPYSGCAGCMAGMTVLDAMTVTSSHELCEAITDPIPGQGWYDDSNGEIGDICAWTTKTVAGYTVQREWSNQANACV